MKQNLTRALALALATSVALSGCATIESGTNNVTQKVGGVFGSSNDNTKAVTGGAILGCAGGAILGKLIGGGSAMLKGCAGGAIAGGVISYKVHQDELKKARAVAADAHATLGVNATVTTRDVQAKDDNGQPVTTQTLDRLVLPLPAKDVLAHAAPVQHVIAEAAQAADGSASKTTLEVHGTAKERAWMDTEVANDLKANSTVKVVDVEDTTPSIVISPIPTPAQH